MKPRRWQCVCAYDGGAFAGWQSQAGGTAIQDVLEARLAEIFHAPVRIHGSGRTDAGVHARAQVFHFDATWAHGTDKLLALLNLEVWARMYLDRRSSSDVAEELKETVA